MWVAKFTVSRMTFQDRRIKQDFQVWIQYFVDWYEPLSIVCHLQWKLQWHIPSFFIFSYHSTLAVSVCLCFITRVHLLSNQATLCCIVYTQDSIRWLSWWSDPLLWNAKTTILIYHAVILVHIGSFMKIRSQAAEKWKKLRYDWIAPTLFTFPNVLGRSNISNDQSGETNTSFFWERAPLRCK